VVKRQKTTHKSCADKNQELGKEHKAEPPAYGGIFSGGSADNKVVDDRHKEAAQNQSGKAQYKATGIPYFKIGMGRVEQTVDVFQHNYG
tara:strand:+ start:282 stop:548 length:267 start_codon:yes stop_codon:yes gene_type:complete